MLKKTFLLLISLFLQCSSMDKLFAPELPMPNNEACPNLGNLKNIPEKYLIVTDGEKKLNVSLKKETRGLTLVQLETAQNSIEAIDTYDKYKNFLYLYTRICERGIPPFREEIKYFKNLKIKIDSMKEDNEDAIQWLGEKNKELITTRDVISKLKLKIDEGGNEIRKTFTLTGNIDSKTENEIFVYGIAFPDNGNLSTEGTIVKKDYYVVSRKNITLNPAYFVLKEMYFIKEAKYTLKNGRTIVLNLYSSTSPDNSINSEEKRKYDSDIVRLNNYTQKEENILKEINEINERLAPIQKLEEEYNRN